MNLYELLILAVVLVFFYAALTRRLITLGRPLRRRLVALGEELLSSREITNEMSNSILYGMENCFSSWKAWAVALLLIPAWLATIADVARHKRIASDSLSKEVRTKWREFMLLNIVCRLMNSPLALLVTLLLLIPILVTSVSMAAVSEHLIGFLRPKKQRAPTSPKESHA